MTHCPPIALVPQEVTEKERQVNQFLQKFQLTAEERAALKGDINTDFFNTLAKVPPAMI